MDYTVPNYLKWLSIDYQLNFKYFQSNETIQYISPKRGNGPYAKKKWKLVRQIDQGMEKLDFDFPIQGYREILRTSHLFLITLTFARLTTIESAWHKISSHGGELNRFRSNLTKIFGSKATVTIKESQSDGYPAPHILVLIDKPRRVRKHYGNKHDSWRLEDKDTLNRIKSAWQWGFVDVEAVISNDGRYRGYSSPVHYLAKYLTKSLDLSKHPELMNVKKVDEIPEGLRTKVYTQVWNKILKSHDFYVSKAFKDRLNNFKLKTKFGPIQQLIISPWELTSIEIVSTIVRQTHIKDDLNGIEENIILDTTLKRS